MKKLPLTRRNRLWILGCAAALAALPVLADSSYSYPRVLEGPATMIAAGGEYEDVGLHQPILVGDRLRVPGGSRLELVLADRSLLRLDGESEIDFESIAFSAETDDRSTVMRLDAGEVQLIVPEDFLGDALPRLETPGATIYLHRAGSFRITADYSGWTELVVRDGLAEMVSDRGSLLVHPGEKGWMLGGHQPRLELRAADLRDDLERWGDWLSAEAARADVPYVDESIRYAARPLADNGVWVEVEHRRAWRPTVVVDWRPYVHGYWRHTPIGLTWVSSDPWGHVTHHYGSWDMVPGHGWVWYPGAAYAPARVHWYWGPSYVGWCPSGYYSNHYARHRRGFGLSIGVYGWAGGSWHPFRHWSFTLHADFGHRRQHRHVRRGAHFANHHGGPRLERGIITTEPRVRRGRHHEAFTDLRREAERRERLNGRSLPDVSDFVARKPLPENIERAVLKPRPAVRSKPVTRVVDRSKPVVRSASPRRVSEDRSKPVVRSTSPRRVSEDRSKPVVRSTTPRRAGVDRSKPVVRSTPPRRVSEDRSKPVVRSTTPRRVSEDRTKPVVRSTTPRRAGVDRSKPVVRSTTPRRAGVDRSKPVVRSTTPRRADVDRSKPVVRSTTPRRSGVDRSKPVVRSTTPRRADVDRSKPVVRSAPSPRASSPRVDRSKPVVRSAPSPRASSPRVDRSKPVVRPAPAPKRTVDSDRSQSRAQPQAKAEKREQSKKKTTARSSGSKSRKRDD